MILVVCLNPALDITHHVENVDWAGVNRPTAVYARPGGKGVNVARTLQALGADVTLLGLVGGPTGNAIEADLSALGLSAAFTYTAGDTRRTFTVMDASGAVALFSEPGPEVSAAEWDGFRAQYSRAVDGAAQGGPAAVVLSGSLPPGLPADAYPTLIALAKAAAVPTLLDTSGAALRHGIAARPDIVKPNLNELAALIPGQAHDSGCLGTSQCAQTSTIAAAAAVREAGAQSVVVSLGPDGLLAVTGDGCWHARPPAVVTGNATGAGDAVVAALAHGLVSGRPWPGRLRHAVVLGAATVASPVAGEFVAADYPAGLEAATVRELPAASWPAPRQPQSAGQDQEAR
ncbi:MAG TPA: 1-phosphofructokinase family hexose kinase [Trebonia sp.]